MKDHDSWKTNPWHFSRLFGSCQSGRWEWHRLLKALIWLDDLSSLVNWKDLNRFSNQIKSWVCSDEKRRIAISIKQDSEFVEWIKQSFTGRRVLFAERSHESWIHHKRFNDSQLCNRWDKARLMHLWSSTGTATARVAYVHVVFFSFSWQGRGGKMRFWVVCFWWICGVDRIHLSGLFFYVILPLYTLNFGLSTQTGSILWTSCFPVLSCEMVLL